MMSFDKSKKQRQDRGVANLTQSGGLPMNAPNFCEDDHEWKISPAGESFEDYAHQSLRERKDLLKASEHATLQAITTIEYVCLSDSRLLDQGN